MSMPKPRRELVPESLEHFRAPHQRFGKFFCGNAPTPTPFTCRESFWRCCRVLRGVFRIPDWGRRSRLTEIGVCVPGEGRYSGRGWRARWRRHRRRRCRLVTPTPVTAGARCITSFAWVPETVWTTVLLHDGFKREAEPVAVGGGNRVSLALVAAHQGEHSDRLGEGRVITAACGVFGRVRCCRYHGRGTSFDTCKIFLLNRGGTREREATLGRDT